MSPISIAPGSAHASGSYLGRIGELRALVDEVAPASWTDPRWWALVSAVAAAEHRPAPADYLLSDAGPSADTFIAWPAPRPADPIAEAIALARAARSVVTELDRALIDQPLQGTIATGAGAGARIAPVALDTVAIAIGARIALAPLAAPDADLARAIGELARGTLTPPLVGLDRGRPFCTISIGDDAWATARHGHRRGWTDRGGPWLGLARAGEQLIASTCHYAIDGFGHALLARDLARASARTATARPTAALPPLASVVGAAPLAIATRTWIDPPRAIELTYWLGALLGDELGVRRGMGPTIQIPVAPGGKADPERWRRRVLPALVSVRWIDGRPEPPDAFARRARAAIAREAAGHGLASRVLAAGRAFPVPVRWKRQVAAPGGRTSPLVAPMFDVLAGRACVSVIRLPRDAADAPPLFAASGPARSDATGALVVTVVDAGGPTASITVTGSGRWATDTACARVLDRLIAAAS